MADYVKQYAKLRTGAGSKYLAYGTMQRPFELNPEKIELDWYLYNCATKHTGLYNKSGVDKADSLINSVWTYQNSSLGMFFANVSDEDKTIKVSVNLSQYKLNRKDYKLRIFEDGEQKEIGKLSHNEQKEIELIIPAKKVIMVEAY